MTTAFLFTILYSVKERTTMKITELTIENLKNAKTGDIIVSPTRGEFMVERFCYQINLYQNKKLVKREYACEYTWQAKGTGEEALMNALFEHLQKYLTTNTEW